MKKTLVRIIAVALSLIMLSAYMSMFSTLSASSVFQYTLKDDGTYTLSNYIGDDSNVVIPTRYNDKLVTEIGGLAFANNKNIKSVAIPLSVETIGEYAFYGCTSLVSISVTRVKNIEKYAFAYCISLERIVIPETVEELGNFAYEECYPVGGANFAGIDPVIKDGVFYGCDNLVIYGYTGSTAETYADENGITFATLAPENKFTDVKPSHWYYEHIKFVTAYDICSGMTETEFKPNANITRAAMITMIWGIEGKPRGYSTSFVDTNPNQWCYDQIAWADSVGVASGTTETTFSPNNSVTKEQIICFLYRYATIKNYDMNTEGYDAENIISDYSQISPWARTAVEWAAKNEIIVTNQPFSPKSTATRAQAATIFHTFIERVDCDNSN